MTVVRQVASSRAARGWSTRAVAAISRTRGRLHTQPLTGNQVQLLVNGEQYFPLLLQWLTRAHRSILLETYIYAEDSVAQQVTDALTTAAKRGVQVRVLIDGFGGGESAKRVARQLKAAGAHVHIYRQPRWWRLERKLLRRLHRKLVVVDEQIAFVGGINIVDDFTDVPVLASGSRGPRFDFAVACQGPIVADVAYSMRRLWWTLSVTRLGMRAGPPPRLPPAALARAGAEASAGVMARFLARDNLANRRTIERAYLTAIESAQQEVLLANAYFLPGGQFRAALIRAAQRGVRVRLLLQGQVEYALQHYAQQALYDRLLEAGVEIYEYTASFLHAKVAVVDQRWATVGSSNIDPYSLLLAREANIAVDDPGFSRQLRQVLLQAIETHSVVLHKEKFSQRGWSKRVLNWFAYALVRMATVLLARGKNY